MHVRWGLFALLTHAEVINYPRRIQQQKGTKPRIIDPNVEEASKVLVTTIARAMRDFEYTADEDDPDFQWLVHWSKAFRQAYVQAVGFQLDDNLSITSPHYVLPWSELNNN